MTVNWSNVDLVVIVAGAVYRLCAGHSRFVGVVVVLRFEITYQILTIRAKISGIVVLSNVNITVLIFSSSRSVREPVFFILTKPFITSVARRWGLFYRWRSGVSSKLL
jgi:hypothetical protein